MGDEEALVLDESGQKAVPASELDKPELPDEVPYEAITRRSQEDAKLVFDLLARDGSATLAEPPEPEPVEEEAPAEE